MSLPPPILLSGPTAVGKSEVALLLAQELGGELVSVDSMQVYRGLDVGTAKPTEEERRRVPHHLVDVVELTEAFDVARFVTLARAAVADIQARGRRPILCGGTGLYFKAFLEGLGEAPPADAAVRAALEAAPLEELLRELETGDPATFARIDRRNARRVVRALEVMRLTGRPYAEQRTGWGTAPRLPEGWVFVALSRDPAELRGRIEARVDRMFAQGLVAETQALLGQGLAGNRTALQAIGYRQVVEHLRGERPLPETVALVKQKTWQFARRQMTWLRRQLPVTWMEAGNDPAAVAEAIRKTVQGASSASQ